MSFSSDTRAEIAKLPLGKKCCKKAYSAAFLLDCESDGNDKILYHSKAQDRCLAAHKAFSLGFGKQSVPQEPVMLDLGYDMALESREAVELYKKIKSGMLKKAVLTCGDCTAAFLRGLFVSFASLSDPEKQYHLEFIFKDTESAAIVYTFLSECIASPKIVNRKNGVGLVYKSSSIIEDLLSVIGATQAYFTLVNGKIEREIRNNENRATNCETRNIAVSVDAAGRQIAAIEKLKAEDKFDTLPQNLKETAEMRLLYPSLPLSELANKFAPPLTKSGLNNRLKKILELAN